MMFILIMFFAAALIFYQVQCLSYVFLSKFKKINRQLPLFFPLVLNSKTIKVHCDKSSVVCRNGGQNKYSITKTEVKYPK